MIPIESAASVAPVQRAQSAPPQLQPLAPKASKPKRDEEVFIVCMPTRGSLSVETHTALTSNNDGSEIVFARTARKPIVEARNSLAEVAPQIVKNNPLPWEPKAWYVLWVDDDAYWTPNTFTQLKAILGSYPQIDIVAGYFGMRLPFTYPCAFRDKNNGESFPRINVDCQQGQLVEVERVGFHFVAHRLSVLEKVGPNPFAIPADAEKNVTEDFAFCDRARAAGCSIVCATGLPIAHIDVRDGAAYIPGAPVLRVDRNRLVTTTLEHLGADGEMKSGERRSYGADVDAVIKSAAATA